MATPDSTNFRTQLMAAEAELAVLHEQDLADGTMNSVELRALAIAIANAAVNNAKAVRVAEHETRMAERQAALQAKIDADAADAAAALAAHNAQAVRDAAANAKARADEAAALAAKV